MTEKKPTAMKLFYEYLHKMSVCRENRSFAILLSVSPLPSKHWYQNIK